jgi:hypothetical protein
MRTHIAYELLAAIWWGIAMLGYVEGFQKCTALGIIVGTVYGLRAIFAVNLPLNIRKE